MKTRVMMLLLVTASCCFLAVPAFAVQALPITITLDEVSNSAQSPSIQPGFLFLCEGTHNAGGCTSPVSDIVDFGVPILAPNQVALLSDNQNGVDSPADTSLFSPDPRFSTVFLTEPVNENGGETITYTPTFDPVTGGFQPGFFPGVTYEITSDPLSPVPEPSTVALMVSGVAPFAIGYLRRRKFAFTHP